MLDGHKMRCNSENEKDQSHTQQAHIDKLTLSITSYIKAQTHTHSEYRAQPTDSALIRRINLLGFVCTDTNVEIRFCSRQEKQPMEKSRHNGFMFRHCAFQEQ